MAQLGILSCKLSVLHNQIFFWKDNMNFDIGRYVPMTGMWLDSVCCTLSNLVLPLTKSMVAVEFSLKLTDNALMVMLSVCTVFVVFDLQVNIPIWIFLA